MITLIDITIKMMNPDTLYKLLDKIGKDGVSELENKLKLTSHISANNIYVFNAQSKMTKFNTVQELILEWIEERKKIYILFTWTCLIGPIRQLFFSKIHSLV